MKIYKWKGWGVDLPRQVRNTWHWKKRWGQVINFSAWWRSLTATKTFLGFYLNPDFFLKKVELPSRIFPEFVLVIEPRNLTISKEKMLIIHEKLEIARNSKVFRSSVIYITRKVNPLNLPPCNFVKKETLALTFSCEFCEIFKNTFFLKHIRTTAPGYHFRQNWNLYVPNFKTESGTSISSKITMLQNINERSTITKLMLEFYCSFE